MSLTIIAALLGGLAVLTLGGELLIRGASKLASKLGIPPLVIGLTVVAFGTSAPELAVSIKAAWQGQSDISLGNVVGSNIFNVLFILGLSSLIIPLSVSKQLLRFDVPLMIAASFFCLLLSLDGKIGRFDGTLLISILVYYIFQMIRFSNAEKKNRAAIADAHHQQLNTKEIPSSISLLFVASGLVALVLGAQSFLWVQLKLHAFGA